MKLISQIGIILGICWISTVIEAVLPFSFPATVIGLILTLILLLCKFLKLKQVKEFSDFMLGNMAFFFVPAGVNIINYLDVLKNSAVQIIIICIISTILTFAATAYSIKFTLYLMKRRDKKHD